MANVAILIVLIAIVGCTLGDESQLAFTVNPDGTYSFAAGGNHDFNLTSGDAFLQANKNSSSTKDGSLKLQRQVAIKGDDPMGQYEGRSFTYVAKSVSVNYQIMVYNGGRFVRFRQIFPQGASHTNISSHDGVVSGFPNFKTDTGTQNLGYINMFDNFCGYSYLISNFTANKFLRGGQRAGPLVVFDKHGNVMVLSAFSNFMAHNMMFNATSSQLHFGIMGGVTNVPQLYEQFKTGVKYSQKDTEKQQNTETLTSQ